MTMENQSVNRWLHANFARQMYICICSNVQIQQVCQQVLFKMRKHLACVDVILSLFPDVIFHLTPNYPDLVKSAEYPRQYPSSFFIWAVHFSRHKHYLFQFIYGSITFTGTCQTNEEIQIIFIPSRGIIQILQFLAVHTRTLLRTSFCI